jgi:hypothetical protein
MRILKTINGEEFYFYVQIDYTNKSLKYRYFGEENYTQCSISEDYNYAILPTEFCRNGKCITKLKLPKSFKRELKESLEHI